MRRRKLRIHFGVVICINLVMGIVTPPVGAGLFIAATLAKVPVGQIVREIVPFLLATMAVLMLLSWRPELVTMALG